MSAPATLLGPPPSSRLGEAVRAARAHLWPALVLQSVAVLLLLAYHFHPPTQAVLQRIAEAKSTYGYAFSFVSTALFGAVLPFAVLRLRPRGASPRFHDLAFLSAFWALKGLEVDALYRLQASWFGAEPGVLGITAKTFVDQFVYVPLWAVPSTVFAYAVKDRGLRTARDELRGTLSWYRDHVLTILLANWLVWVPTVVVVYQLELPLQLPVQNLVLCLWALLVQWFTNRRPVGSVPCEGSAPPPP